MISDPHKVKYIKIDNRSIPVWIYGKSNNPPIIFIHGYYRGFSDYSGDLPPRYLMKNYCVICFDLPGFGKSKQIKIDSIDFISEIQKQILKNKKANMFGISYGGLLALKYTYKYPTKVNKVIIAGTPVFYGIFNLLKLSRFFPIYKNQKIDKEMFEEFTFLNKFNLTKIRNPILLYYNKSDFLANVLMGKKLNRMLLNSDLFITRGLNHSWLLHRIDKSGFLREINIFLSK